MSSFGCLTRLCLHRHTWLDDHPRARDRHPRCRSTVPNGQEACYVLPSSKRHQKRVLERAESGDSWVSQRRHVDDQRGQSERHGAHHHRHRGPCRDRRADRPASSSPNVSITKGLEGRLGIPPLRESSPVGPPPLQAATLCRSHRARVPGVDKPKTTSVGGEPSSVTSW